MQLVTGYLVDGRWISYECQWDHGRPYADSTVSDLDWACPGPPCACECHRPADNAQMNNL